MKATLIVLLAIILAYAALTAVAVILCWTLLKRHDRLAQRHRDRRPRQYRRR